MIFSKVYKGTKNVCKIYKGDDLVWLTCTTPPTNLWLRMIDTTDNTPVPPTDIGLQIIDVSLPAPTALNLEEIDTLAGIPGAPTDLLLEQILQNPPTAPTNLVLTEQDPYPPAAPTNIQLTEIGGTVLGTLVVDSYGVDSVVISLPITYNGTSSGTWDLYVNGGLWGTYADAPISGKYIGGLTTISVTLQILHRDNNGVSQWSNQVVQQLGVYPPTELNLTEISTGVSVTDPSNLRATNQNETSISIAWDSTVPAADQYYIWYKKTSDSKFLKILQPNGNLTYTLNNLEPDTEYQIKVYGFKTDLSWISDFSNLLTHSTEANTGDTTPPTAPTSFTSIVAQEDRITATWTGATDNVGVIGYNLYIRGSDNSNFVFIKFVPGESGVWDSFENYSYLIHGSVYTIEVESVDAAGNVSPTRLRSNRIYTLVWDFSSSSYLSREMGATRYADAPSMTLGYTGWSGYRKQIRRGSVVLAGPTYNNAIAVEPTPTRTTEYFADLDTDQDDAFDFTRQFTVTII